MQMNFVPKYSLPTSKKYFEKCFPDLVFKLKNIYILPRIVTVNIHLRAFQYKVLNNILYINKHLFIFKFATLNFCIQQDETVIFQYFYFCS